MKWWAHPASDDARLTALSAPDRLDWVPVDLPASWASVAGLDHADGVLLRATFDSPPVGQGQRLWVEAGGIRDQADLWLDGAYLGDQDGYFRSHSYDISELNALGGTHDLVLETHGGANAGVWRPITLQTTGPARINSARVLTRDATEENAHVLLTGAIDSSRAITCTVRTSVDGTVRDERRQALAKGTNNVSWNLDIPSPRLWWPHFLGEAAMTDVRIDIVVDGQTSHSHGVRTGLRQATFQNWTCTVNGERLFLDGAHVTEPGLDAATATRDEIVAPLVRARGRGLDLVRVCGHVAHPDFYAAADEMGMLLLQDLPVRGSGRRGRKVAARWTAGVVDSIGHHPSVLAWHHRALDQFTARGLAKADPSRDAVGHLSTLLPASTRGRIGAWLGTLDAITRTSPETSIRAVPNLARFLTHEELELVPPMRPDTEEQRDRLVAYLRSIGFNPTTGYCFEEA
ncbi:MAG: hypothetical protein EBS48_06845 [Actinobacteria bacterium]|nr:hypothetical protein [Actinomycetota bacterium]